MQVLELGEIKAEIEHINSLGETEDLPPTYGEAEQSGGRRSGRVSVARTRSLRRAAEGRAAEGRAAEGRGSSLAQQRSGHARGSSSARATTEGGGSDSGRRWPQLGASTITSDFGHGPRSVSCSRC